VNIRSVKVHMARRLAGLSVRKAGGGSAELRRGPTSIQLSRPFLI
jgi:hypothetical protein